MSWKRSLEHKRRMKKLSKTSSHLSGAYYVDEIWIKGIGYVENPKPYYKRYYRGSRSAFLKKMSNRKIRRYNGEIRKGAAYHRLYDFWWEID